MPGPKPTPTNVLKLRNSWRANKRRNEPKPSVSAPALPTSLAKDPIAKAEWKRITKEMTTLGTAAQIDHAMVEAYCVCYSRWRQAEAEIASQGPIVKSPNGYPMLSPWLSVANTALTQLDKFASQLGLSPSARTKLETNGPKPKSADPLEDFFSSRGKKKA